MVTSYVKKVGHVVLLYVNYTDASFTTNTYIHVTDTMQQTVTNILGNLLLKSVLK